MSVLDPASTITVDSSRTRRTHLLARGLYELTRVSRLRRRRMRAVRRVLHVSPALFGSDGIIGGGERAAYGLARAVARELPTTFVSFGTERLSQRHGELTVEIYPSAGAFGGQPFDPLSYRFLEQVRRADIVHCHQYRVAVSQLAILTGAAMRKRVFVTDRGGVGVHFDPELPVERCLTALLPLSRFSRDHLPAGVPARVIHGGVTELFLSTGEPVRDPPYARHPRVLYVGRIMRHKGVDVLIQGIPEGIGLDVVGHAYDQEYLALLRQLAVGRDVSFVHDATDDQLMSAYRNALVTVLPSVYRDAYGGHWPMPELLGNVLLESMGCGTPVICTNVGGMPEIVKHGLTGFVVAPNDPAALGSRIAALAANLALRLEMGRNARADMLENFTWKLSAQRTLVAYREAWDTND